MIRYYHRLLATASAETDDRAAWLVAHGWQRCTANVHRALWWAADYQALAQMRATDPERPADQEKAASIVPSGWKVYHV